MIPTHDLQAATPLEGLRTSPHPGPPPPRGRGSSSRQGRGAADPSLLTTPREPQGDRQGRTRPPGTAQREAAFIPRTLCLREVSGARMPASGCQELWDVQEQCQVYNMKRTLFSPNERRTLLLPLKGEW